MAGGVVHVPWYATLFRGDAFQAALGEIAPIAMRYGATFYDVYRSQDDQYKFLQCSAFADKASWEAYWYGPEFIAWREDYSSWYQVPILYVWNDLIHTGHKRNGNGEERIASLPPVGTAEGRGGN
jgi:quinol monooxygenase YgiN